MPYFHTTHCNNRYESGSGITDSAIADGMGQYADALPIDPSAELGDYMELSGAANPGDDGFITISRTSFNPKEKKAVIKGVTFEPAQTDEWFFMGLSNITQNHHGNRDQHYDDIDFCIFIMGHGQATARENEEEVGPYVEYRAVLPPTTSLAKTRRYCWTSSARSRCRRRCPAGSARCGPSRPNSMLIRAILMNLHLTTFGATQVQGGRHL